MDFPFAEQKTTKGPQIVEQPTARVHVVLELLQFVVHQPQSLETTLGALLRSRDDVVGNAGASIDDRLFQQVNVFVRAFDVLEGRVRVARHRCME